MHSWKNGHKCCDEVIHHDVVIRIRSNVPEIKDCIKGMKPSGAILSHESSQMICLYRLYNNNLETEKVGSIIREKGTLI